MELNAGNSGSLIMVGDMNLGVSDLNSHWLVNTCKKICFTNTTNYINSGNSSELNLFAGDQIQLIAPGSVRVTGPLLWCFNGFKASGQAEVATLKLGSTVVSATGAELNLLDGGASASSVTIEDTDSMILSDGGVMKRIPMSDVKSYAGGASGGIRFVQGSAGAEGNIVLTTENVVMFNDHSNSGNYWTHLPLYSSLVDGQQIKIIGGHNSQYNKKVYIKTHPDDYNQHGSYYNIWSSTYNVSGQTYLAMDLFQTSMTLIFNKSGGSTNSIQNTWWAF